MAITLTEAAARHVNRYPPVGKRVGRAPGVKTTGCSCSPGWHTSSNMWTRASLEDIVFENHGVKVLIDPKSLAYIDGTELDFVREGLNEGFKVQQPQRAGPLRLGRASV